MNIQKFLRSFGYAYIGFKHIWQHHQNIRFHILAALGAFIFSIVLKVTYVEYLILLITIFFVIVTEMMNTAIEEMTDLITTEHRKEAAVAKDVAAAAVLLSSLFSIIVASIIFLPKLIQLLT